MPSTEVKLRYGLRAGAKAGWSSFVWILRLLVTASFIVTVVEWAGGLAWVEVALRPLMQVINLPGEAAIPVISGMLMGNYVTIAILTALPFTLGQMTLIAVFSMIAHNLVIEGVIQHTSGMNVAKITVIRIVTAILTVMVISQFFTGTAASITVPVDFRETVVFTEMARTWAISTGWLLLRIFGIIMGIMILLALLRIMGWITYVIRACRPVMRVLGLSDNAAALWVTTAVFGLMFGGAVIMEEAKEGNLNREELERLHLSIGINHSMVEDPVLFLALGIGGFWLWIPRLIAGIAAVQIYRLVGQVRRRSAPTI